MQVEEKTVLEKVSEKPKGWRSFDIFLILALTLTITGLFVTFIQDQIPSFYESYGWPGCIAAGVATSILAFGMLYWSIENE